MHSLITTAAATENAADHIHSYRNAEASVDLYFHRKFKLGKELKGKLHFLSMHSFPRSSILNREIHFQVTINNVEVDALGKTKSHHFYYFSVDIK